MARLVGEARPADHPPSSRDAAKSIGGVSRGIAALRPRVGWQCPHRRRRRPWRPSPRDRRRCRDRPRRRAPRPPPTPPPPPRIWCGWRWNFFIWRDARTSSSPMPDRSAAHGLMPWCLPRASGKKGGRGGLEGLVGDNEGVGRRRRPRLARARMISTHQLSPPPHAHRSRSAAPSTAGAVSGAS